MKIGNEEDWSKAEEKQREMIAKYGFGFRRVYVGDPGKREFGYPSTDPDMNLYLSGDVHKVLVDLESKLAACVKERDVAFDKLKLQGWFRAADGAWIKDYA